MKKKILILPPYNIFILFRMQLNPEIIRLWRRQARKKTEKSTHLEASKRFFIYSLHIMNYCLQKQFQEQNSQISGRLTMMARKTKFHVKTTMFKPSDTSQYCLSQVVI